MEDRYHRGYRVKVKSFRSGSRWRTEVSIAAMKHPPTGETILPSPIAWSASSEEEADQHGLAIARAWIANSP